MSPIGKRWCFKKINKTHLIKKGIYVPMLWELDEQLLIFSV